MQSDASPAVNTRTLSLAAVAKTWWPLAASWLLMGAEMPALSAIVARLPNPEINLAAYGGVVFPLALIIEAPVIMLLSASVALSKDRASYRKIHAYMQWAGFLLTTLHVIVAWTPLYYVVVRGLLGTPEAVIEPARIGLKIMVPWTWAIGYRRFNQGIMIRFGHSRSVGAGTIVRLAADLLVLGVGYALGSVPGIVVATAAVAAGVTSEAIFAGLRVRPVLRYHLDAAEPVSPPLSYRGFFAFYVPLALTSLLGLLASPIGSAAMGRMPQALASLAAWPVVSGLAFLVRSPGFAYNEVVVAMLDRPGAVRALRRFAILLTLVTSAVLVLIAGTPIAPLWFAKVSALSPGLAAVARSGLWLCLPLPALTVMQSWYQGAVLHSGRTRGITESIVVYLVVIGVAMGLGIATQRTTGLYVALGAIVIATLMQDVWLWWRARPALAAAELRDHVAALAAP